MRIVSLLPAATEMVYLLGLGDELVGVSHECDYPSEAALKPRLTRTLVDASRPGDEIQQQVGRLSHDHRSLYELDIDRIRALKPDLILTQEICEVCAVSRSHVEAAALELYGTPNVVSLEPSTLEGVLQDIELLGGLTGRQAEAALQTSRLRDRIARVLDLRKSTGEAVVSLEWLQPLMAAGHWIPEMIEIAGGRDAIMTAGEASRRITWDEVRNAGPQVVVIAPCGCSLSKALGEYRTTPLPDWWTDLPALRSGRIFAVDGHNFTSRPGPRLVDALEIIATIIGGVTVTTATYGVDYVRIV